MRNPVIQGPEPSTGRRVRTRALAKTTAPSGTADSTNKPKPKGKGRPKRDLHLEVSRVEEHFSAVVLADVCFSGAEKRAMKTKTI